MYACATPLANLPLNCANNAHTHTQRVGERERVPFDGRQLIRSASFRPCCTSKTFALALPLQFTHTHTRTHSLRLSRARCQFFVGCCCERERERAAPEKFSIVLALLIKLHTSVRYVCVCVCACVFPLQKPRTDNLEYMYICIPSAHRVFTGILTCILQTIPYYIHFHIIFYYFTYII